MSTLQLLLVSDCLALHLQHGLRTQGNFLMGAIGVQMYAMAMGKLAVMNHPLMSWLFSHPDSRQSWTPLQLTAPFLNKAMRHEIIPLESAAVNAKNIKFVGLHGVSSLHNSYRVSMYIHRVSMYIHRAT